KNAGITLSVIFILGLGGRKHSQKHARETAKILSQMDPDFIGALTLMVIKGTKIYEEVEAGELEILEPREVFAEVRTVIENLHCTHCIFRANHASNYLPIGGTMPGDKQNILHKIDNILKMENVSFKPEWLRAL
ncbi:MAG: radical SAM protein, partial [Thermoplasmata archaeon]